MQIFLVSKRNFSTDELLRKQGMCSYQIPSHNSYLHWGLILEPLLFQSTISVNVFSTYPIIRPV